MDNSTNLARFFKALGDDTRLRLVALLAKQELGTAMCVSRLARELETTVPNVSQHLRILKNLDLVYAERRRYRLHYYLNNERFSECFGAMAGVLGNGFLIEQETDGREGE